jgi:hypothetical protein
MRLGERWASATSSSTISRSSSVHPTSTRAERRPRVSALHIERSLCRSSARVRQPGTSTRVVGRTVCRGSYAGTTASGRRGLRARWLQRPRRPDDQREEQCVVKRGIASQQLERGPVVLTDGRRRSPYSGWARRLRNHSALVVAGPKPNATPARTLSVKRRRSRTRTRASIPVCEKQSDRLSQCFCRSLQTLTDLG